MQPCLHLLPGSPRRSRSACLPPRNPLGLRPSFPGTRWNFGSRTRPPLQSRNSLWHDPSPFSLFGHRESREEGHWVPGEARLLGCSWCHEPDRRHCAYEGTQGTEAKSCQALCLTCPLTTGIAPQRDTASLGTGTELMALRIISGHEMAGRGFWDSLQDGKGPPWRKSGGSLRTVVGLTSWRNNLCLGNELFILPPNCRSISFFIIRNMNKKKEITRKPWIHEIHLESK